MPGETAPARTPRYNSILAASEQIAHAMGHSYVGVEHLFLAILRDPDAVPTQVAVEVINVDSLDNRLVEVMNSRGYRTPGNNVVA